MQHSKKQKLELQNRRSLKTILNLEPNLINFFIKSLTKQNQRLISKSYSNHYYLQTLRILTLIQVNYLVSTYIQLIKKADITQVNQIKIGIIGGGIFGRLILNTLIVFTKQGINPKNILVSTRQPSHLQWYVDTFGIQVIYDNQNIAQRSDILFVTTPATLDNWIITDIKKVLQTKIEKIDFSNKSYQSTTTVRDLIDSKQTQSIQKQAFTSKKTQTFIKNMKQSTKLNKESQGRKFNQIVYITTSDFTDQKCKRLFNFPVLTPWIRVTQIHKLIAQIQNLPQLRKTFEDQTQRGSIQKLMQIFQQFLAGKIQVKQLNEIDINNNTQPAKQVSLNEHFQIIIQVFKHSAQKVDIKLREDFMDNIRMSQKSKKSQQGEKTSIIDQILVTQGDQSSTFLARTRKWRMAYHNFIS